MPAYQRKRVLIVVRTYPTPARTGAEVSCTAAISEDGRSFVRLFPVPYRFLANDSRFRKYQWIEVDVTRSGDPRPESFKIRADSIRIVSDILPSTNYWQARKDYVLPLRSRSLCELKRRRDADGFPTLGVFKPRSIHRLVIQSTDSSWTEAQLNCLRQMDLFQEVPHEELEKVPFKFKYEFDCDDQDCNGHSLSCTDWEMAASWRSWKDKYGSDHWEAKFRQRYEREMIEANDTHFYVGTVHQHPKEWIVVGLFYPPKAAQRGLFDLD